MVRKCLTVVTTLTCSRSSRRVRCCKDMRNIKLSQLHWKISVNRKLSPLQGKPCTHTLASRWSAPCFSGRVVLFWIHFSLAIYDCLDALFLRGFEFIVMTVGYPLHVKSACIFSRVPLAQVSKISQLNHIESYEHLHTSPFSMHIRMICFLNSNGFQSKQTFMPCLRSKVWLWWRHCHLIFCLCTHVCGSSSSCIGLHLVVTTAWHLAALWRMCLQHAFYFVFDAFCFSVSCFNVSWFSWKNLVWMFLVFRCFLFLKKLCFDVSCFLLKNYVFQFQNCSVPGELFASIFCWSSPAAGFESCEDILRLILLWHNLWTLHYLFKQIGKVF